MSEGLSPRLANAASVATAGTAPGALDGSARARSEDALSLAAHVRVVRLGHGANCSSVGSVIDTLFVTAVAGSAIFAAIAAALAREETRVVGRDAHREEGDAPGAPPPPPGGRAP